MMAIFLDFLDFLYACKLVDRKILKAVRRNTRVSEKLFCVLELSSMFRKENNRK